MYKARRPNVKQMVSRLRFSRARSRVVPCRGYPVGAESRGMHAVAMLMAGFFIVCSCPVLAQITVGDLAASRQYYESWRSPQNIYLRESGASSGFFLRDTDDLTGHLQTTNILRGFTIGYRWRNVQLEQTALAANASEQSRDIQAERPWIGSGSSRLSFTPSPNWRWRIGNGMLGQMDQMTNEHVRRSAISTTYIKPFEGGDWQTTLAWGKRTKRPSEPVTGYLIESVLKFRNTHSIIGSLEQVGSDDPARANAPPQRSLFKMNKLTVGYSYHVDSPAPVKIDVGGMVSRHFVPSEMASSYGSVPTLYMMFVRMNLD